MAAITRLRVLLGAALVLTGCTSLIGVHDIFLDDSAGTDGGPLESSTIDTKSPEGDGGADASCVGVDTTQDKKNCGRCGHDCLGGECSDSKCQAFQLGGAVNAPLWDVAVSTESAFFATSISLTTQAGGVWRIKKTGGGSELYVDKRYAEAILVLGEVLYFTVDDDPGDAGTGGGGGLYSCPVTGTAPCKPTLLAAATGSRALTTDGTKIYYGDQTNNTNLMVWDPATKKSAVFRADYGSSYNYVVDDAGAFYTYTFAPANPPQHGYVYTLPATGEPVAAYDYASPTANAGTMRGGPGFLLFTAYDQRTPGGGVVQKIPQAGSTAAPCSYGGSKNKRPYGVVADSARVYWTGLGDGPGTDTDIPFTGGTLSTCEVTTCCTDPEVLWTGDGQPTAVTLDADAVYFVTKATSSVWKIAKP